MARTSSHKHKQYVIPRTPRASSVAPNTMDSAKSTPTVTPKTNELKRSRRELYNFFQDDVLRAFLSQGADNGGNERDFEGLIIELGYSIPLPPALPRTFLLSQSPGISSPLSSPMSPLSSPMSPLSSPIRRVSDDDDEPRSAGPIDYELVNFSLDFDRVVPQTCEQRHIVETVKRGLEFEVEGGSTKVKMRDAESEMAKTIVKPKSKPKSKASSKAKEKAKARASTKAKQKLRSYTAPHSDEERWRTTPGQEYTTSTATITRKRRPKFTLGTIVNVFPQTWDGVNVPSGVARVTSSSLHPIVGWIYTLKYVMGGSCKNVEEEYLREYILEEVGLTRTQRQGQGQGQGRGLKRSRKSGCEWPKKKARNVVAPTVGDDDDDDDDDVDGEELCPSLSIVTPFSSSESNLPKFSSFKLRRKHGKKLTYSSRKSKIHTNTKKKKKSAKSVPTVTPNVRIMRERKDISYHEKWQQLQNVDVSSLY